MLSSIQVRTVTEAEMYLHESARLTITDHVGADPGSSSEGKFALLVLGVILAR